MTNEKQNKKSRGKSAFLILVITLIVVSTGYWQWKTRYLESTDDAFVESNLVYLTPRVSGLMTSLNVKDNQFIKQDSLIAQIDTSPYKAELAQAQAKVDAAKADLTRAESERHAFVIQLRARRLNAAAAIQVAKQDALRQDADLKTLDAQIQQAQREVKRYLTLQKAHQVSRQLTEETQTNLETLKSKRLSLAVAQTVAKAKLEAAVTSSDIVKADEQQVAVYDATLQQAKASLQSAEAAKQTALLHLQWSKIKAPHTGWISKITARPGSQLSPNQSIGVLVFGKPWITANFKETQIGRMRIGDPATIEIDALSDIKLKGHVDSFQAGTGARFSLLPPENATGNFVKVVQRLPVKIVIDTPIPDAAPLWPGLSAVITVDVSKHEQSGG
jgi:membrane fusion protein (multidrug efflux system)